MNCSKRYEGYRGSALIIDNIFKFIFQLIIRCFKRKDKVGDVEALVLLRFGTHQYKPESLDNVAYLGTLFFLLKQRMMNFKLMLMLMMSPHIPRITEWVKAYY